jgi:VWFA-related protein
MLTYARSTAAFLLSALFTAAAFSQQTAPPPAALNNKPIQLDVVVTPKSGLPVTGLDQKDFTVFDNKAPQTITLFNAFSGPNSPVDVILLIDAVNTGYQTIAYERTEIEKFLRANGGKLAHPATLAILTDTGVRMVGGFSTDGNALASSLDNETVALRAITRSAGFYGAEDRFNISMRALSQLGVDEAARPGRKLIFWISPGWPLLSGPRVQLDGKQLQQLFDAIVQASTQLRLARITLYNINPLGTPRTRWPPSTTRRSSRV